MSAAQRAPEAAQDEDDSELVNQALEKLIARGAIIVAMTSDGKRPAHREWQKYSLELDLAKKKLDTGGHLGIVPGSVGMAAVDVDNGDPDVVGQVIGELPLARYPSKSRGEHLWYRVVDGGIKSRTFSIKGISGDVKSRGGCITVWDSANFVDIWKAVRQKDIPIAAVSALIEPDKTRWEEGERNASLYFGIREARRTKDADREQKLIEKARRSGMEEEEITTCCRQQDGDMNSICVVPDMELDSFQAALDHCGFGLKRDIRSMTSYILIEDDWEQLTDNAEALLGQLLIKNVIVVAGDAKAKPWKTSIAARTDLIRATLRVSRFDPIKDMLAALPEWDGVERVERILIDHLGAEDCELSKWAAKAILLGAIIRTFEPGAKMDEMVVLQGAQGQGKSAFLGNILPPEHSDFFVGDLSLLVDKKEFVEAITGAFIVEIAEMSGLSKADSTKIKSRMTATTDKVRLAYERNAESLKRTCVMVGTTNESDSLPADSTGNRRFVPIPLGSRFHVEPYMEQNREQLLAEALVMYIEGQDLSMASEVWAVAKARQTEHTWTDESRLDAVRNALYGREGEDGESFDVADTLDPRGFTLAELMTATWPEIESRGGRALTQKQAIDAVRRLGGERLVQASRGDRTRYWSVPEEENGQ